MILLTFLGMIVMINAQLKSLSCSVRGFDEPSGCEGLGWNYADPNGSPSYCYCSDYHCNVKRDPLCCNDYCEYCGQQSPGLCPQGMDINIF